MKHLKKKWIFSFLLVAVFLIIFTFVQLILNTSAAILDEMGTSSDKKAESIINTYEIVSDIGFDTIGAYDSRLENFTAITASLLKETLAEDPEENVRACYDGYVALIDGTSSRIPDGLDADLSDDYELFKNDSGNFLEFEGEEFTFWFFSRIRDNYFFLKPFPQNSFISYASANESEIEAYSGLENAYGVSFSIMFETTANDNSSTPYVFSEYTSETMKDDPLFAACKTMDDYRALNEKATEGERIFKVVEIPERNALLVMSMPLENAMMKVIEESGVSIAIIFISLAGFIVLILSILEFVKNHHLTDEQKTRYKPASVRKLALSYGIISTAIICMIIMFTVASRSFQEKNALCDRSVSTMQYRVMLAKEDSKSSQNFANQMFHEYGRTIDSILADHPELATKQHLKDAAEIIDADFITIYDSNGNETVSSTDLIGLKIGTDEKDPTSVFRKILNGVESVYASDINDPYYGTCQNMIGVRTAQDSGAYGAMLIGVNREDTVAKMRGNIDNVLLSFSNSSDLALIIDKETKIITNSSDDDLNNTFADGIGLGDDYIRGGISDFMNINRNRYYAVSGEYDNSIYYYFSNVGDMFENILPVSLITAVLYLLIFICLCIYLLHGYTPTEFNQYAEEGEYMLRRNRQTYTPERLRREYQAAKKKSIFDGIRWSEMFPDQRARLVIQILCGLLILRMLSVFRQTGQVSGSSIFYYLLYGNWTHGINMFAFSAIILVGIILIIIMTFVHMIFNVLLNTMSTKGITIGHLVLNLIRYTLAFVYLYLICFYLGFDPRAVVVSAGIVTFTVSFGAKDIITDMLAGILIIFEGDFQVGDIIQIGDFRGTVLEIGVRSTKLIGNGNNIKTIPNQNVKNVLNLTRMNSWYTMEIKIPSDVPIIDLENMLNEELPKISARIPEIINGPEYKGVINLGNGFMTILLIAEYDEDDYYKVQRKMNREMMLLFNEKNIKVL